MIRVLIPVDGSECSLRAVRHMAGKGAAALAPGSLEVHLINVQAPLPTDVTRFVSHEQVAGYHRDASVTALAGAREILDAAGIRYEWHAEVGPLAETIVKRAEALACDEIVMGAHGRGALTEFLLGSTVIRVVHLSHMPVLLVK